jgi:hypothetical protein
MIPVAEHVLAIQNLKADYCAAADLSAADAEGARAVFAQLFDVDAVGDYGAGAIEGGGAIAGYLCAAIGANSRWVLHMIQSPRIEVDGDHAIGRWTVLVHLGRHGGLTEVVRGRYEDEFRRGADGWRIAGVRFVRVGD